MDVLENAQRYFTLHQGMPKAFEFLLRPDLHKLPMDRYEIDGDRLYAMISKGPGRKRADACLETHRKYLDIQLVLAGVDNMGWKRKSSCRQLVGGYELERDVQFFGDKPEAWLAVNEGAFVVFFPEDAHLPLISEGQIHKVVVKIAVKR